MISKFIDHTLLKPDATQDQIKTLCAEACDHNFAAVCVNAYYVPLAHSLVKDSEVKVCTVVGFPLGASPSSTKAQEAQVSIEAGADEIDMVINIGALKDKKYDYVLSDIQAVKEVCDKHSKILKVIIETSLLNTEEKIQACKATSLAGASFIKTSTGFAGGGATVEDITLMKENISESIQIKASGGVRDLETAQAMIAAGASRIGTSSGIAICKGLDSKSDY